MKTYTNISPKQKFSSVRKKFSKVKSRSKRLLGLQGCKSPSVMKSSSYCNLEAPNIKPNSSYSLTFRPSCSIANDGIVIISHADKTRHNMLQSELTSFSSFRSDTISSSASLNSYDTKSDLYDLDTTSLSSYGFQKPSRSYPNNIEEANVDTSSLSPYGLQAPRSQPINFRESDSDTTSHFSCGFQTPPRSQAINFRGSISDTTSHSSHSFQTPPRPHLVNFKGTDPDTISLSSFGFQTPSTTQPSNPRGAFITPHMRPFSSVIGRSYLSKCSWYEEINVDQNSTELKYAHIKSRITLNANLNKKG